MARLPDELALSILDQTFPCRRSQIRALATLTSPNAAPCRNCIVHGTEATGKSAVVAALLQSLGETYEGGISSHEDENEAKDGPPSPVDFAYAIVNSLECVTGRHLFETTLRKVADAIGAESFASRCENLAQLNFELSRMLKYPPQPDGRHFVLVFDGIDRQRESPPTLLPALARLSEAIPCLTTIFIVTNAPPHALLTASVIHVHFPNYTKADFVQILSTSPPPTLPNATAAETADLWARFCGAVHDTLTKSAARTLPAFRLACDSLWRRFTAPIREGNLGPKDFSKLLIAARVHFQDESLLDPGIVRRHDRPVLTAAAADNRSSRSSMGSNNDNHSKAEGKRARQIANGSTTTTTQADSNDKPAAPCSISAPTLAALLPTTARILLIAAYLASHNPARHDLTLFSTYHHGRKRRRGRGMAVAAGGGSVGGTRGSKHRKIARKLLGAHAFVLERMMAIFMTVRLEWGLTGPTGVATGGQDADVGMALATLSSLRLLVRVGGGGDPLDRGGKWRVNVGWEVVRGLGRSMGVEVEEWLVE